MGTDAVRFLVLWMAGWINSRQLEVIDFLREENRVLREQLGGRRLRFTDDQRRRLAVKRRIVGRRRLGEFEGLVTPETILRWYRELIARKYDGSARRRTGRPTVATEVEQLVVRMATENPTWGYTRLVGALDNLGHQVGRNTIKRVLRRHGLEPAPARGKRMPWKTFLRTHLGAIAAADFFSVEELTLTGLVRYLVLFVIDLQTRRVQIGGVVRHPYEWSLRGGGGTAGPTMFMVRTRIENTMTSCSTDRDFGCRLIRVRLHKKRLDIQTRSRRLIDITSEIQKAVSESRVLEGIVNIFIVHTSASLLIQENADPKVLTDLERFLGDLVPDGDQRYQHTEEGPDDMSAHVRSMLTASTLTIPLESGKLGLGQWQAVYLWEHRHARDGRTVQLSILGNS